MTEHTQLEQHIPKVLAHLGELAAKPLNAEAIRVLRQTVARVSGGGKNQLKGKDARRILERLKKKQEPTT